LSIFLATPLGFISVSHDAVLEHVRKLVNSLLEQQSAGRSTSPIGQHSGGSPPTNGGDVDKLCADWCFIDCKSSLFPIKLLHISNYKLILISGRLYRRACLSSRLWAGAPTLHHRYIKRLFVHSRSSLFLRCGQCWVKWQHFLAQDFEIHWNYQLVEQFRGWSQRSQQFWWCGTRGHGQLSKQPTSAGITSYKQNAKEEQFGKDGRCFIQTTGQCCSRELSVTHQCQKVWIIYAVARVDCKSILDCDCICNCLCGLSILGSLLLLFSLRGGCPRLSKPTFRVCILGFGYHLSFW